MRADTPVLRGLTTVTVPTVAAAASINSCTSTDCLCPRAQIKLPSNWCCYSVSRKGSKGEDRSEVFRYIYPYNSVKYKFIKGMRAGREVSISLDGVRDKNIMQLKKLNTALFPVRYNDKYYADALASGEFTKLAYYSDICVGSIACRLEKKEDGAVRVYIMTLGVLAPYRRLGIGTKLLSHVMELCSKQNIGEIYLHVQTSNDDAISFYKKFGFEITDTIQNYYINISPPDCYVVSKFMAHSK